MAAITWKGVFPAATTQFAGDYSLDVSATQSVQDALVRDGVNGLVVMGTVGENNSLIASEKRTLLTASVEVAAGRVPIIAGVSEMTTAAAGTICARCGASWNQCPHGAAGHGVCAHRR